MSRLVLVWCLALLQILLFLNFLIFDCGIPARVVVDVLLARPDRDAEKTHKAPRRAEGPCEAKARKGGQARKGCL